MQQRDGAGRRTSVASWTRALWNVVALRRRGAMRKILDCSLLETFVRVADFGNISAAARSLFIAQSAVSTQMTLLSRMAGTPLLERVHGRWQKTSAGTIFYAKARELLTVVDGLERALADASGHVAGHLVIASTRTISDTILARVVSGFAQAHPEIRLDILAGNRHDAEMRLAADEVDGALVALPITGKGLRIDVFDEDRLVLVVPDVHPLAARASLTFTACADEPFVMFERGSGVRALLEERLGERFHALDIRLELTSNDSLLRCVEEKIGITFLPERVAAKWLVTSPVVAIAVSDVDLSRKLAFVVQESRPPSTALAAFSSWVNDAFGPVESIKGGAPHEPVR